MRTPYTLVLGVSVIIGLSGSASIRGAERADAFPVVVVVDDRVKVHPQILDQAKKEAARLFWQAGVATEWRTAPARATGSAATEDRPLLHAFTVLLLIQAHVRVTGDPSSKFLMGAAPATSRECGGTAYLFDDQVVEFARTQRLDAALVMGTVVAHEVGHFLLRQRGHSAEGLMRASWDSNDWQRATMGFLLFSSLDVATIRSTISSCRQ
jgi:hypothetical protein